MLSNQARDLRRTHNHENPSFCLQFNFPSWIINQPVASSPDTGNFSRLNFSFFSVSFCCFPSWRTGVLWVGLNKQTNIIIFSHTLKRTPEKGEKFNRRGKKRVEQGKTHLKEKKNSSREWNRARKELLVTITVIFFLSLFWEKFRPPSDFTEAVFFFIRKTTPTAGLT